MRTDITLVRIFGCLLVILLLAGCASSSPRSRYLEQIEPGSLPNLIAYRGGTNLEIRYPFLVLKGHVVAGSPEDLTEHAASPELMRRARTLF